MGGEISFRKDRGKTFFGYLGTNGDVGFYIENVVPLEIVREGRDSMMNYAQGEIAKYLKAREERKNPCLGLDTKISAEVVDMSQGLSPATETGEPVTYNSLRLL